MKKTAAFQYEDIQVHKFGYSPFKEPKMFVHTYFIDGLLIDTGQHHMQKEVLTALTPLSVKQILVTHHHEDHTGNLKPLQAHFQCPSYASHACVELMKAPPPISFAQYLTWGNRPANFDLVVKAESIATAKFEFEFIPVPGHAVDMIALYEANKGWLFSADLWVYDYIRYFMRSERMAQQIESLKRVLTYDFEVLLCSHNPQFKNGKQRIYNKLQFLEDFYGKVAALYHAGHSIPSIFKQMQLKRSWSIRLLSMGALSTKNMIASVIRDEQEQEQ